MEAIIDLFLNLDVHLAAFVQQYGVWVYGLLFAVVFAETGLVVTPFLPGDSLLFAVGALAAAGALDLWLASVLLFAAAVIGDAVNYAAGHYAGPRVFTAHDQDTWWHRVLNRDHLDKAHEFFERHGGKAVVLARFVPIVRTFVPFVAGGASMTYPTFFFYNVTGALAWVGICVGAGYLFGNVPIVKDNFTLVVLGIIVVSILPIIVEFIRARRGRVAEPVS
ncbi:MAG: DedA family protein [Acidobacteriota bacterium]